jgi:hypothetical protein
LELQERVRELYEQKDNVNYQDRDLFEIPLESRLQHSVSIMRAWVTSTSKTLGICIEDFAAATARSNSDIRDYLPIRVRVSASPPPTVSQAPTTLTETHQLVDTSGSSSSDGDSDCESSKRKMHKKRAGRIRSKGKSKVHIKQNRGQRHATDNQTAQSYESDTTTESESGEETKMPPIAKKFTPKPKKQSTLTAYNFVRENVNRQQSPRPTNKETDETRPNNQEWFSPQTEQHRWRKVSSGNRVWDAGRTNREGGGGPARVAKFRDRSAQQLGSAADSTPVVL